MCIQSKYVRFVIPREETNTHALRDPRATNPRTRLSPPRPDQTCAIKYRRNTCASSSVASTPTAGVARWARSPRSLREATRSCRRYNIGLTTPRPTREMGRSGGVPTARLATKSATHPPRGEHAHLVGYTQPHSRINAATRAKAHGQREKLLHQIRSGCPSKRHQNAPPIRTASFEQRARQIR